MITEKFVPTYERGSDVKRRQFMGVGRREDWANCSCVGSFFCFFSRRPLSRQRRGNPPICLHSSSQLAAPHNFFDSAQTLRDVFTERVEFSSELCTRSPSPVHLTHSIVTPLRDFSTFTSLFENRAPVRTTQQTQRTNEQFYVSSNPGNGCLPHYRLGCPFSIHTASRRCHLFSSI